ncbi:MAG TPA: hypothetical protein VEN81_05330, partial [Planctomycetota bacterium]|nr:hypothetical protein [Planctomycetota bacterium]
PPWGHLRGVPEGGKVFLNGWRESQFLKEFEKRFVILEYEAYREGEHLLTPERERELSGWTRDELTKRAFRAVLTRR